ncbi:MAG: ArsI/CadI family heavy metal resistance metalloenzyme [Cyanobacteria bacterium P01_E01_bin.42]
MSVFKTHVALNVKDLHQSVAFYQAMLGQSPIKYKGDYAKFDLDNPALNLSLELNPERQPGGALSHLGIQVETQEEVQQAIARFQSIGLELREDLNTTCCYGVQDKVWVKDPDGNEWEIFALLVADTHPARNLTPNSEETEAVSGNVCCATDTHAERNLTSEPQETEAVSGGVCCA